MIKFSANISFLFTEFSFLDRFKVASENGFTAVEYLFPYKWDPLLLKNILDKEKLRQVLFNISPGSETKGEKGLASLVGREEEFKIQIKEAIHYAKILECTQIHIMAGIPEKDSSPIKIHKTFLNNLSYAADQCGKNNIYSLIEPINNIDIPGYYLNYTNDAAKIINELNHPFLRMQLDLYHTQIMSGNLSHFIKKYIHLINHIQIASPPNRYEPDKGEINYDFIFKLLKQLNYSGYIGCEYKPSKNSIDSLNWIKKYR